jgi:hypothetical protein
MKQIGILLVFACVLANARPALSQDACSVIAHGAKGDCTTDDTAAFQEAVDRCGSFFIPRPPEHGRCYRVNGVRLQSGITVTFQDRNTGLWPTSPQTPYIFSVQGQSMAARSGYTTIRGGILWAPFSMRQGTAGIRTEYGDHVRLEDLIVNGFYDDIFADNTDYLTLERVTASGSTHANLWDQHSDVKHGPYFGGPLYVENSTLDSCECSGASIWVQDIAVVNITDSDIVGVSRGHGFVATSSNGLPGTPPDYPAAIHLQGDTFDTIADTPISISNYTKSDIAQTWVSGGRALKKPCITLDNVEDISISNTHVFWCGLDGIVLGHAVGTKITTSTFSGTPHVGIHLTNASESMIFGNSCKGEIFNGNGSATQLFCVYEESSAHDNRYLGNDASGTTHGNSYHGKNPIALMP